MGAYNAQVKRYLENIFYNNKGDNNFQLRKDL